MIRIKQILPVHKVGWMRRKYWDYMSD